MRLIGCYIQNFGRLSAFSYDFSEGLNILKAENGWGKTTFAVFLKSMLYGMEKGGTKATKDLRERNRYMPWQGGVYGGNLTFEVNGKTYRVERSFGEKEKDDTYALFSVDTGLPSNDLSEPLGESLFALDRESFERSIFIRVDDMPAGGYLTDNVNAKLNHLIENADDINNYEEACKRLTETKKNLQKKDKDHQQAYQNLKDSLDVCNSKAEAMVLHENQISELRTQKSICEEQRHVITEEIKKAGLYERKQEYRRLTANVNKTEEELAALRKFFPKEVPDADAIRAQEILLQNIVDRQKELMAKHLCDAEYKEWERISTQMDEETATQIPERMRVIEDKIVQHGNNLVRIAQLSEEIEEKKELYSLQSLFSKKLPTKEEWNEQSACMSELRLITAKKRDLRGQLEVITSADNQSAKQADQKKISLFSFILLVICGGVAAAGAVLLTFMSQWYGAWMAIGGLIAEAIVLLTIGKKKSKKSEMSEHIDAAMSLREELSMMEQREQKLEANCLQFLADFVEVDTQTDLSRELAILETKADTYLKLRKREEERVLQTDALRATNLELAKELEEFFTPFTGILPESEDFAQRAQKLREEAEQYRLLCSRKREEERTEELIENAKKQVQTFLQEYGFGDCSNAGACIRQMYENRQAYETAQKLAEHARNDVLIFTQSNDTNAILAMEETVRPVAELQADSDRFTREIEHLTETILSDEKMLDELSEYVEKKPEIEREMERLKNEQTVILSQITLLDETMRFLSEAKERISMRYLAGMKKYFASYIAEMNGEEMKELQLDLNLSVEVSAYGKTWRSDYLSSGFQDFISVCMKLALVDAMFESETPFVILDDPFVNLDEIKMENAKRLLKRIAKKHQVLYFVCHESRSSMVCLR